MGEPEWITDEWGRPMMPESVATPRDAAQVMAHQRWYQRLNVRSGPMKPWSDEDRDLFDSEQEFLDAQAEYDPEAAERDHQRSMMVADAFDFAITALLNEDCMRGAGEVGDATP